MLLDVHLLDLLQNDGVQLQRAYISTLLLPDTLVMLLAGMMQTLEVVLPSPMPMTAFPRAAI